jgi:hypothetical protein
LKDIVIEIENEMEKGIVKETEKDRVILTKEGKDENVFKETRNENWDGEREREIERERGRESIINYFNSKSRSKPRH